MSSKNEEVLFFFKSPRANSTLIEFFNQPARAPSERQMVHGDVTLSKLQTRAITTLWL